MIGFPKLAAGLALTVGIGGLALSAPARAASWHEDCSNVTGCVRTYCDDDGYCGTSNSSYSGLRPQRYACDSDGEDCHWTRNYFYDDDGNPVFDPNMTYP